MAGHEGLDFGHGRGTALGQAEFNGRAILEE
jgi:hypothetical protein